SIESKFRSEFCFLTLVNCVFFLPGVPYAPPAPAATVTHLVVTAGLHDSPGQALCPHCQQTVVTVTHHTAGLMTWGICAGLTFFGCFLCCFLPFCIESCKDVEHRCPTAQSHLHIQTVVNIT
uniref:LITAF domain-containing protein n=1 Tax=Labrus bergylta TaxID=56723 RepID=A0A3Q3E6S2_9LABR